MVPMGRSRICEYMNLDEDEVYKFIYTERMRKNVDLASKRCAGRN